MFVCSCVDRSSLCLDYYAGSLKEDVSMDACNDDVRSFVDAHVNAGGDGSDLVVTVLSALGEERIVACKACSDGFA